MAKGFIVIPLMILFAKTHGQRSQDYFLSSQLKAMQRAMITNDRLTKRDTYTCSSWYYNWRNIWSSWSQCDHTCGGGMRTRNRYCTQSGVLDRSSCGQICFNHGTFINGKCQCTEGFEGSCCEVLPVCQPVCENNGTCIAKDVCKCSPGYYGQSCEIGSSFKETMLPKLNPAIPLDTLHNKLSWYDSPDYDSDNEICYIKVHIQNAPYDTIFTAESIPLNETGNTFGNFTAAPIDLSAGMNDSSRFACLQVRCPGTRLNGKDFDVLVRVSVKTRYKHCHARYQGKKPLNINVSSSQLESDSFTVVLENGKKYGRVYGVYFYTGSRDKAQYLAKHACYSGHNYDYNHFLPTNGVLADYMC